MGHNSSNYYFTFPNESNKEISLITEYLLDDAISRPVLILIGGPTGVGKSSLSIKLCELLGIRNIICTDTIRCILANQNNSSILNYFSHECWKFYGEFSKQNLISGFRDQTSLICDKVEIMIQDAERHQKHTVIEGVHLLPSTIKDRICKYPNLKIINLCITTNYDFFINTLLPNRIVSSYRHRPYEKYQNRFEIFQYFFELWDQERKQFDSYFIDNTNSAVDLLKSALEKIYYQLKN